MEIPEQDYHNFSSSSSHRLPTISGIEAIRNARKVATPIPTSLPQLDNVLSHTSTLRTSPSGGIQRGLVTEVFGPPGSGKTTFALQLAVNALKEADQSTSVTWIDTSSQLLVSRLEEIADAYELPLNCDLPSSPPLPQSSKRSLLEDRFNYLQVTSLPRLLALFLGSTASFPPHETGLIVLDDLSNLILSSLPHASRSSKSRTPQKPVSSVQDAAIAKRILSRRFQVLSSLAACMQKFAATNSIAILVTSKATVNFKNGQRATLRPALSSQQWDNHLSVRIVLYRDFWPDEKKHYVEENQDAAHIPTTSFERRNLRLAKVIRLGGKLVSCHEVGFVIEQGGLRELKLQSEEMGTTVLPLATQPLHPLEDSLGPEIDDDGDDHNDEPVSAVLVEGLETLGATKRKAIEIADSDDDSQSNISSNDEQEVFLGDSAKNDGRSTSPSPQLDHNQPKEVSFSTAKKLRADSANAMSFEHTSAEGDMEAEKHNSNEMGLKTNEKSVLAFSQAGAEMSDPLTPSDLGDDMS